MKYEDVVRAIGLALMGIFLVGACSSTTESKSSCPIAGTYTVTGATESGDCASQSTSESGATSTTYTITALGAGDSADFAIEIQGLQGGCAGDQIDTCKVQGKCNLLIKDALSSADDTGTFQFSWTFDSAGFAGTYALRVPPAKSLTKGCTENGTSAGTRR